MDKLLKNKFLTLFLVLCVTVAFTFVPTHIARAAIILQILTVIATAVVIAAVAIATGGAGLLLAAGTAGLYATAIVVDCLAGWICHNGGDDGSSSSNGTTNTGSTDTTDTTGSTDGGGSTTMSCSSFSSDIHSISSSQQKATLSWTCSGVSSCSIDPSAGSNLSQNGSIQVQPTATTTYTLSCVNSGNTISSPGVTVGVAYQPSCSFSVDHSKIVLPQRANLSWSCEDADLCSITQNDNSSVFPADARSGTRQVSPSQNTVYTLTCNNTSYSTTKSQNITVSVSDPHVIEVAP